jgi:transcriptional regulator with XRE-family HTH domain
LSTIRTNRIRDARVQRGYTQAQMARALKTHERQIVRWERGESHPRPRAAAAIAEFLGVPIEHLFAGDTVSE